MNPKPKNIEELVGWKSETKEFSSKCFDLAMERNKIERLSKIKDSELKLTQMISILKDN